MMHLNLNFHILWNGALLSNACFCKRNLHIFTAFGLIIKYDSKFGNFLVTIQHLFCFRLITLGMDNQPYHTKDFKIDDPYWISIITIVNNSSDIRTFMSPHTWTFYDTWTLVILSDYYKMNSGVLLLNFDQHDATLVR